MLEDLKQVGFAQKGIKNRNKDHIRKVSYRQLTNVKWHSIHSDDGKT